jgi:membrane carboxypeptidase/penicillin-binding protein PbpC
MFTFRNNFLSLTENNQFRSSQLTRSGGTLAETLEKLNEKQYQVKTITNMKKLIIVALLLTNFISNSQCPAPSNVNLINNIAFLNTVELSWTENGTATSWDIAIVPDFNVGSTIPTNSWITASSNPFVITGIPPSFDCYAFFVRSSCSPTNVSNWTGSTTLGCSITAYYWFLTLSNDSFLSNSDNNTLQIYPNPTKNIISIKYKSEIEKIKIYDYLGKEVLPQTQNNNEINVENLAKGIYLIEVQSENGKFHRKFIKE